VAKFDKVIPPGREGKIELAIGGDKVHGEFTKSATVESNDPDHPHMTLTLTGKEIPYVDIEPQGTVNTGDTPSSRTAALRELDD